MIHDQVASSWGQAGLQIPFFQGDLQCPKLNSYLWFWEGTVWIFCWIIGHCWFCKWLCFASNHTAFYAQRRGNALLPTWTGYTNKEQGGRTCSLFYPFRTCAVISLGFTLYHNTGHIFISPFLFVRGHGCSVDSSVEQDELSCVFAWLKGVADEIFNSFSAGLFSRKSN